MLKITWSRSEIEADIESWEKQCIPLIKFYESQAEYHKIEIPQKDSNERNASYFSKIKMLVDVKRGLR